MLQHVQGWFQYVLDDIICNAFIIYKVYNVITFF